jgi:endonuclease I
VRKIAVLFIVFISSFGFAQVTLSSSEVSFGDVFTNADKEIGVDVTNTSSRLLTIGIVKIYNEAFSYTIGSTAIEAGKSQKFRIKFSPKHNLAYNSELLFSLSDGSEYRIDLTGNGRYTDTYYDATFNKSHQALKDELKSIISANYVNFGYNGARDKMYGEIDNVNGKVTCVYTGRVATFNTRSGATSQSFNCEHTWPQSLFNQNEPERADMHHLFSTDETANGRRANYPFGVVSNASWSDGGSKLGGSVFEPRDEQKGASARAMLYFVLRYQDYSNFIDNQEATLVDWHKTFGPSAIEIARNESIFSYQKNRNPMVDHPEFIERINVFGGTDTKPVIKQAEVLQQSINYGNVTTSQERVVYLTNTGNQTLTGYTVTSSNSNVIIKSVENSVAEGEVAKITIGFSTLSNGTYNDSVIINLNAQSGQRLAVPVQFSLGLSGNEKKVAPPLCSVRYNSTSHSIQLVDVPQGLNEVQVYTASGKRVFNEISTSFTDIPTIGYNPGVYFVVVNSQSDVFTTKILIY